MLEKKNPRTSFYAYQQPCSSNSDNGQYHHKTNSKIKESYFNREPLNFPVDSNLYANDAFLKSRQLKCNLS